MSSSRFRATLARPSNGGLSDIWPCCSRSARKHFLKQWRILFENRSAFCLSCYVCNLKKCSWSVFLSGDGQRDVAVSPRAPTARPPIGYCLVLLGLQVAAALIALFTSIQFQGRKESTKNINILSLFISIYLICNISWELLEINSV